MLLVAMMRRSLAITQPLRLPISQTIRTSSRSPLHSTLRYRRIDTAVTQSTHARRFTNSVGHHDRVLLASMGIVGGGVAVTAFFHDAQCSFDTIQRAFYGNQDDSWSGQLKSSIRTLQRRLEDSLQDDNRKVIAGLIASNIAVWGLWRLSFRSPSLERFMWRHFACSYQGVVQGKRIHTLFTSAFSHITIPHIAINMFMLWEFGSHILAPKDSVDSWINKAISRSRVVDFLRTSMSTAASPQLLPLDKFLTLYATSALASSTLSIVASRFRGTPATFTIGASGAVMGVLTMYCLLFPERRMMLYGLFELTATEMLQLMTAVNIVGSAFQRGLHIDFTGHLGGQVSGLAMHQAPQLS